MCKKLIYLVLFVLAVVTATGQAEITPITDIIITRVDNPGGAPNFWLESITVGGYTVTVDELVTGVSTGVSTASQPAPYNEITNADSFDLNSFAARADEVPPTWQIKELGGKSTWLNTNGDNPDFFLFETGGNQDFSIEAILPGGTLGQSVNVPQSTFGDTGLVVTSTTSSHDGQTIEGVAFAITDLLDQNGNNLTNSSIIEGIQISSPGIDPSGFYAVASAEPWLASAPSPADGATDVPPDVSVGWKPGIYAAPINGHKVYLSENFNDVNDGIGGITQSANSYARPQRLDFSTTYYWRVDEVNGPPDYTVYEGRIWSFTTEPIAYAIENITVTASSQSENQGPENTINGSGLDVNDLHSTEPTDMWLSGDEPNGAWIEYELDKVYKLHEMWVWNSNQMMEPAIGLGSKDVSIEYSVNGTDYTTLGTAHEFAQGTGAADYAHNTTIDFSGAAAKYVRLTANSNWGGFLEQYGLSEVRFLYIPVLAREPSPDSGTTDVSIGTIDEPIDVTLGFRAGREAARHDVYLSSDWQAVADGTAPVTTVTESSYGPLSLDLGKTYYWKINEVNEAETPTMWQGDIWNFRTQKYFVVDDFEDYNDYPPDEIWAAWVDGYGIPTNGATVGYPAPDFLAGEHYVETTIVYGGEQAMPLFYSNTGTATYSEGERTFAVSQDWTTAGIQTLVLYFYGTPGNTGQLYVKLNNSKVLYDGDAADIARPRWRQWNIDLASLGVSLQDITKMSIGVDGAGASGIVFIDDILLYRLAPEVVVPSEEIWIEAEAGTTITAPMKVYDDPAASGGKYIGTDPSLSDSSDNPPAPAGTATYTFTVEGGVYKLQFRVNIPSGGDSLWVRIPGATTQTTNHSSGWVKFNGIQPGNLWHWDDVFSDDDPGDSTVLFTMPAGTYTLEIAYREAGVLLDAIVITVDLD